LLVARERAVRPAAIGGDSESRSGQIAIVCAASYCYEPHRKRPARQRRHALAERRDVL